MDLNNRRTGNNMTKHRTLGLLGHSGFSQGRFMLLHYKNSGNLSLIL